MTTKQGCIFDLHSRYGVVVLWLMQYVCIHTKKPSQKLQGRWEKFLPENSTEQKTQDTDCVGEQRVSMEGADGCSRPGPSHHRHHHHHRQILLHFVSITAASQRSSMFRTTACGRPPSTAQSPQGCGRTSPAQARAPSQPRRGTQPHTRRTCRPHPAAAAG